MNLVTVRHCTNITKYNLWLSIGTHLIICKLISLLDKNCDTPGEKFSTSMSFVDFRHAYAVKGSTY